MDDRVCSRPGCRRYADRTVTVDYAEQLLVVGPLQPASRRGAIEGSYDLCEEHADRHAGPSGWRVVRHQPGDASAGARPGPRPVPSSGFDKR